ncbi:MAG: amino-acid N-acetyltransferase [Chitinispirillaceae bacterium]|nr:amino-acid N-acetyltransferase [Chitinispirillaceae bacterium]
MMNRSLLKEQVEVIRQAFGYINQFKHETFVIKIESTLLSHPLFPLLIKDMVLLHEMGINVIIVPGARERIDDVLKRYDIKCKTVNGVRISPPEAIPLIKMAAFDVSNKIMTMLTESGVHAVIGNWVRAKSIGVRNGVDFQSSGTVEKIRFDIVKKVLSEGLIPIFPNIGWSAKGKPYNLSSAELAFWIAVEMNAAKLFYVIDRLGIMAQSYKIPKAAYVTSDGVISQLKTEQAGAFLDLNITSTFDEQLDLVAQAYRACKGGVRRVHIIDGRVEGMLLKEIFSNRGFGTMIYANQHDNIRPMTIADLPEILRLMQPTMADDVLVHRDLDDLEEHMDDYIVYEVDGTVHACAALHVYADRQAEIAGLTVDETYKNLGIGKRMISYLIEAAAARKLKALFVLTTQTADWFSEVGFTAAKLSDLPRERQRTYNKKRKSLILRYKLSGHRSRGIMRVE